MVFELANKLGQDDKASHNFLTSLLSPSGSAFALPLGITVQAQEASQLGVRFNATAGVARQRGEPLALPSLLALLKTLSPAEIVDYAPTGGIPELRALWQNDLIRKNPSLIGQSFSLPIVTAGLSHAISLSFDLFAEQGDLVLCAEPSWENYRLMACQRHSLTFKTFPLFDHEQKLNLSGLARLGEEAIKARQRKAFLILNFPHNPTGYTPLPQERQELLSLLGAWADRGMKLIVLLDDAYFGFFYEDYLDRESLFPALLKQPNLLAIKIDGPTKEYYTWGLRLGFLTAASPSFTVSDYAQFENKALAAIRTSVSSASKIAQSLICKLLQSPSLQSECQFFWQKLKQRYAITRRLCLSGAKTSLEPLPFNSGYFLTFKLSGQDAFSLRSYLLRQKSLGTIALAPDLLRVTYASLDEEDLPEFFTILFESVRLRS